MLKSHWKLAVSLAMGLVMAGCAPPLSTSVIRPLEKGQRVPILGGYVLTPGYPWGITIRGRPDLNFFTVLTTGDYEYLNLSPLFYPVLTVELGPRGIGIGPWTGNEMIVISSKLFRPKKMDKSEIVQEIRTEILKMYGGRAIRDISAEYEDQLKFWYGHLALAYQSQGRNYRVVHAFAIVPSPWPDSHALHGFSYIQMEKPGAKENFNDFVPLLKSIQLEK